jgi:predicted transposase/invertase (TIGR01784 family)
LTTAEQLMKRGEELGMREGRIEGRREGMREGMREAQRELVRSMVERGMTVADVARYTGLAVTDVQSLLEDATT